MPRSYLNWVSTESGEDQNSIWVCPKDAFLLTSNDRYYFIQGVHKLAHILIFFQIFSLLCGVLLSYYFFQARKTAHYPIARPIYFYVLLSALFILTTLLIDYLGINVENHGCPVKS